jgi:hypothetical protein
MQPTVGLSALAFSSCELQSLNFAPRNDQSKKTPLSIPQLSPRLDVLDINTFLSSSPCNYDKVEPKYHQNRNLPTPNPSTHNKQA